MLKRWWRWQTDEAWAQRPGWQWLLPGMWYYLSRGVIVGTVLAVIMWLWNRLFS